MNPYAQLMAQKLLSNDLMSSYAMDPNQILLSNLLYSSFPNKQVPIQMTPQNKRTYVPGLKDDDSSNAILYNPTKKVKNEANELTIPAKVYNEMNIESGQKESYIGKNDKIGEAGAGNDQKKNSANKRARDDKSNNQPNFEAIEVIDLEANDYDVNNLKQKDHFGGQLHPLAHKSAERGLNYDQSNLINNPVSSLNSNNYSTVVDQYKLEMYKRAYATQLMQRMSQYSNYNPNLYNQSINPAYLEQFLTGRNPVQLQGPFQNQQSILLNQMNNKNSTVMLDKTNPNFTEEEMNCQFDNRAVDSLHNEAISDNSISMSRLFEGLNEEKQRKSDSNGHKESNTSQNKKISPEEPSRIKEEAQDEQLCREYSNGFDPIQMNSKLNLQAQNDDTQENSKSTRASKFEELRLEVADETRAQSEVPVEGTDQYILKESTFEGKFTIKKTPYYHAVPKAKDKVELNHRRTQKSSKNRTSKTKKQNFEIPVEANIKLALVDEQMTPVEIPFKQLGSGEMNQPQHVQLHQGQLRNDQKLITDEKAATSEIDPEDFNKMKEKSKPRIGPNFQTQMVSFGLNMRKRATKAKKLMWNPSSFQNNELELYYNKLREALGEEFTNEDAALRSLRRFDMNIDKLLDDVRKNKLSYVTQFKPGQRMLRSRVNN